MFRLLWESVYPPKVSVLMVVVDGQPTDSGLVYTTMNRVAQWYYQQAHVILRFEVREATGLAPGPELRQDFNGGNYPVPTIFVFPIRDLINGALGDAYGEFMVVGRDGMAKPTVYRHELGHWFGLGHLEGTFMSGGAAAEDAPAMPDQVAAIRLRGRLYSS
ncbi:MAG TPA: hypothetical protein VI855_06960 [Dehalococcoidia bacterium]|nr:hypothetical protein [Dehalococcoidia bacterium]